MAIDAVCDIDRFKKLFYDAALGFNPERFPFISYLEDSLLELFIENFSLLSDLCSLAHEDYETIDNYLKEQVRKGSLGKDRYAHSRVVSDTTGYILDTQGKPRDEINLWRKYALLHDIGKFPMNSGKIKYKNQDSVDNSRVSHIIFGEIIANYFSLQGMLREVILFHHDLSPLSWNENPIHLKKPLELKEHFMPITYADYLSSLTEPWRHNRTPMKVNNAAAFIRESIEFYEPIKLHTRFTYWLQGRQDRVGKNLSDVIYEPYFAQF